LQRAIGALIVTHPEPQKFAQAFAISTGIQQLDQLAFAQSRDDVRSESKAFALELYELANAEVEERAALQKPCAD
jgi:hypothetical protein